ncbi:hypothetical protein CM240_0771 [Clostridium bornimense]|uniref:Uncharacterized protein n=1 Tax=Clostridium bornimense TaxID=1216932 RepID=W6RTL2_9CLOT|nr:glycosyltransferase [Clostridium bornimense]CDM67936.1 hypothetical protein CM240_0771 [Clostridium bornimense]
MKDIDLIVFPFHDYKKWLKEGFRTRDAHLFESYKNSEFVNKVLVVNRPVSIAEMVAKKSSWKTNHGEVVYKENNWVLMKTDNNVYYIDMYIKDVIKVIIERKQWWDRIFRDERVADAINKSISLIGMKSKCILLQNPMAVGILEKLDYDTFVFDAIDNWVYHPQMNRYSDIIRKNYEFIIKNADAVFTVSKNLEYFFEKSKYVKCISNGVNKEYFSESISIKDNDTINIGYVGKIQERIDFELVEKCISVYKECNFIFMGPVLNCRKKIIELKKKYENVKFTGDIHYKDLPKMMKKIDIAIMPHKKNKFTDSMNPIKLYEYIAAGKQLVTTNIAGVDGISPYVYISNNDSEFISYIQFAIDELKNNTKLGYKIVKSLNEKYTWEYKSQEIINDILLQSRRKVDDISNNTYV